MGYKIKRPRWLTNILILLVCVLTFLFGSEAGLYYMNQAHEQERSAYETQIYGLEMQVKELRKPSVKENVNESDLARWQTYKSPYLFNFKIPNDWLVDGKDPDHLVIREAENKNKTSNIQAQFNLISDKTDENFDTSGLSFADFAAQKAKESCASGTQGECVSIASQKKINNTGLDVLEFYLNQKEQNGLNGANSVVGPIYAVDVSKYTSEARIFLIKSAPGKYNGVILLKIAETIKF